MRLISLFLGLFLTAQSFGFESVHEFWETYRATICSKAKEKAAARVEEQKKSGKDTYDGDVLFYKGKRIVRFILSETPCQPLWSATEGKVFDYSLRIQVEE